MDQADKSAGAGGGRSAADAASGSSRPPSVSEDSGAASRGCQIFATTHWSVVLAAGEADSERARLALENLCRAYWPPLYAHIRRLGYPEPDAKDLTQAFFARLLKRNDLAKADPRRGRFRNFLLKSFTRFVQDEWDKSKAEKRGGNLDFVSFDDPELARALTDHPASILTPAEYFERHWAMTVLAEAWRCLRQEYARRGQADLFDDLRPHFVGDDSDESCAQLAGRLGKTTEAIKSAIKHLKRRYGSTLREVVGQTVASPREVDEELSYLLAKVAN